MYSPARRVTMNAHATMYAFHAACLRWRAQSEFDNEIAGHLPRYSAVTSERQELAMQRVNG